jgi:small GTP-binding protein
MKAKVCLVGELAVGKTSLIRRFVYDEFDDRYLSTLGAKISKKDMFPDPGVGERFHMIMTIWDIMGDKVFRELLREAYFYGAQAILAVCDLTRHDTLEGLEGWVDEVFQTVGEIPVVIAVNKDDLRDQMDFSESQVARVARAYGATWHYTSAKTGLNVEEIFDEIAEIIAVRTSRHSE